MLVSGGCALGADSFAKSYAKACGYELIEYLPKLSENLSYREMVQAYYARNELIAINSDMIIALVTPERTGGTENTIKWAEKYKRAVVLL